jgi:hypothetical protein
MGLIRRVVAICASVPLIVYALGVPIALSRFHVVLLLADPLLPFEIAGLCICASLVVGALAVPSGACLALVESIHRWLTEPLSIGKGYGIHSYLDKRLRRRNAATTPS